MSYRRTVEEWTAIFRGRDEMQGYKEGKKALKKSSFWWSGFRRASRASPYARFLESKSERHDPSADPPAPCADRPES